MRIRSLLLWTGFFYLDRFLKWRIDCKFSKGFAEKAHYLKNYMNFQNCQHLLYWRKYYRISILLLEMKSALDTTTVTVFKRNETKLRNRSPANSHALVYADLIQLYRLFFLNSPLLKKSLGYSFRMKIFSKLCENRTKVKLLKLVILTNS